MPALTLILALTVGATIAFQTAYIWQLHGQAVTLQAEITRLNSRLCTYQRAAALIAAELSWQGSNAPIPPPDACNGP